MKKQLTMTPFIQQKIHQKEENQFIQQKIDLYRNISNKYPIQFCGILNLIIDSTALRVLTHRLTYKFQIVQSLCQTAETTISAIVIEAYLLETLNCIEQILTNFKIIADSQYYVTAYDEILVTKYLQTLRGND